MPIHRPCPYPHVAAARGMCWHSLSPRCFHLPVLRSWLGPQTVLWRREKAGEVFGDHRGCAAAVLEMRVCRHRVSVAASLLGCWGPRPAQGTRLLPPGCSTGVISCSPCTTCFLSHATQGWHGNQERAWLRAPGRSYGQRGPQEGMFHGLEHLVLSPA